VLDWSSVTWVPGSLSNSYDIDPSSPGNDITITLSGNTNTLVVDPASGIQTPAVTDSLQGGAPAGNNSLELATNMIPPNKLVVTVTFSAQYLRGVNGVSFTLFDIDVEQKQDVIDNISARDINGIQRAATISNLGFSVSLTGAGFGQKLAGNADSPDAGASSGLGDATISFGNLAIKSFTFTFDSTPGGPKLQKIGISDITFSPVPEINPALATTALCGLTGLVISRRAKKRAAELQGHRGC
jgi:hypothetical protein